MASKNLPHGMGTYFKERDRGRAGDPFDTFDKVRSILLDAHRFGLYETSPLEGVQPPQYDPARAVIPSAEQLASIRVAGDDTFRLITDLTSGCGLRNATSYYMANQW
ncbi:hypothetical protein [Streptomyces sp. NPDC016845]|uniref:hypothetical protein n=1 Tax=Streptomyces sp. NPDC016845 TaxID=3364972 RepID=UPI0037AD4C1E